MKVLLANKFFYPRGGDCIHTMQLKQLLISKGHEVAVYSMQYADNIDIKDVKYWPEEVSFSSKSPIQLYKALLRPFGDKEVRRCFKKQLKAFKPDIVHLHNIHSQLSPSIAEVAKELNIAVLWTLHDYKLLCPAYTFIDNEGNICEECYINPNAVYRKKCIKGSLLGSIIGYLESKKWNRERIENAVDQFISPSLFLRNKMHEGGYSNQIVSHIYNFADDQKFQNEIYLTRKKQVVYVGRLSKEKGVETLCKAFGSLKEVELKIIGDGPLRENLVTKYSSDQISFLGFRDWEFIKNVLSESSLLVIPSEWYENNPLTIIEALALGTPVLGARIGGITELVNQDNGMLFNPRDVTDLKRKLEEMVQKEDWNYEEINEQAKRKFSQENYYQSLIKLYKQYI